MSAKAVLTTNAGIPVADNQNSVTAGPRGPVLPQDFHLIEKLQAFNRERIPERVVHAKGSAAYGRSVAEKLGVNIAGKVATIGEDTKKRQMATS